MQRKANCNTQRRHERDGRNEFSLTGRSVASLRSWRRCVARLSFMVNRARRSLITHGSRPATSSGVGVSLLVIAFALTACAGGRQPLERGALSPDTMIVLPVQNLSGRPLKIPEIYLGDAVGKAAELEVESINLADLAEAGVYTRLSGLGYRAELEQNAARLGAPARYEVHSAVTLLDFDELRGTGRFRMGVVVMLVDAQSQREVARGHARREFQLFDHAPDEVGALGTDRFIERRLQIFTESLAGEAVDAGGVLEQAYSCQNGR